MSQDDRCIHIRRGKIELSKYWPDGSRYRRVFPSKPAARVMRAQIDVAIASGIWRELKAQLKSEDDPALTLAQFSEIFLDYCRKKNRRPDFHEEEVARFLPIIGTVRVKDFTRADAVRLQEWRSRSVAAPTVNRMMAVLRSLFSYAMDRGEISAHPMVKFRMFREERRALRVMTMDEERTFIGALLKIDPIVGIMAGVMGEAALRTSEAERLVWPSVDLPRRILSLDLTKSKKARYIPISDFCAELLEMAPRVTGNPFVFVRLETFDRVKDTRGPFEKARAVTGLDWIHPEDFRHFRATQWVRLGLDLKTVQELLGHADIHTTMRYAHFAPAHAARSIVEAQRAEAETLRQLMFDFRQDQNRTVEVGDLEALFVLEAGKS